MKKMSRIFAGMLAASLLLAGCGGPTSDAEADANANADANADASNSAQTENTAPFELTSGQVPTSDDIKIPDGTELTIGYLAQNETDQFCVFLGQVMEDEAAKFGGKVKVIMSDAQSQAAIQVSQAEDMAIKKPDCVILNAVDGDASAPAVTTLTEAGIPVVLLNTTVSNVELASSYVGIDDTEVGELMARMIGEAINGKGTVNVIQGLLGHPANERRWEGLQKVFAEEFPDITIGSAHAADWDRNKAMNVAEDWISSGDKFDAVISLNDEMAISAGNAFEAAGISNIPVVGGDGIDEMLELIKSGKMYGTVFQNGDGEGRCAMDVAIAVALGVEVDKEYMIPNEIVTAENVDEYFGRNTLE